MNQQIESFHLLESVAQSLAPHNTDLLPHIRAAYQKEKRMRPVRRITAAILIILLAFTILLLTVPDVAMAMRRIFGFIPGVGIVDQSATIRVLAEPVSMTRDGITLTVEQAILTSDKTVIIYKTEGVPQEARPKGESGFACNPSTPTLLLPDGTKLNINGGSGTDTQFSFYYPPIPADVNTVKFLLPCLLDVAPAAAPQDWELTLRFVPAPPDMTVVPVIEITTPLPTQPVPDSVSVAESDSFMGLTYHLESMQRTQQGYILETSIQWEAGLYADSGVGTGADVTLTDATGKAIDLSFLQIQLPGDPHRSPVGYSINNESFTAPLTLTLPWVGANLPFESNPQFTFDPGANPQPGQEWQINQSIDVLGHLVKIVSARYVTNDDLKDKDWMRFMPEELYGFEFTLEADPAFRSIALAVQSGYSADGVGTSGSPTVRDENGIIKAYAMMGGKIISPLTIEIPYVDLAHQWQISFNPADILTDVPRSSTSFLDASLQIEKVIPIDEGYYLIGRTNWNDSRLSDAGIGGFDAKLLDANGTEYPIESASFDEIGITDVQPGEWAYKVYGKALPASLTLKITQANPQFIQPYSFTFDPGANPQLGQEWQINQTIEILGYKAAIQSAKFIQQGDQRGFEFSFTADPALQGIPFNMESGITNGNSRGGGASPRDENGVMKVYALSDGQYTGPILIAIHSVLINGNWQTVWNPPANEAGATPVLIPQACVTLDKWKQAIANPEALPSNLPQKVLLSRGALSPDPSLFISSLDGASEQGLVFGHGSLSHDGTKLVYSGADNGLYILDISSGQISTLMNSANDLNPFWSPDGNQIAFMRQTDKGMNIFMMDANGQNTRALTDTTDYLTLFGWTPDGQHLLFNVYQPDGTPIQSVDLASGNIETLVTLAQSYNGSVSISHDGTWIAYADKVIGKMYPGIFISRLDGSEKKLLMQLEGWMTVASAWTADGKWLTINVTDTNQFQPITIPALVNVDTCQVLPLMNLNGEIVEWIE
jgi:hypothetical protein